MVASTIRVCSLASFLSALTEPDLKGTGPGRRLLYFIARLQWEGRGRIRGRRHPGLINTSHPGLGAVLRRDPHCRQVPASLRGPGKSDRAKRIGKVHRAKGHGSLSGTTAVCLQSLWGKFRLLPRRASVKSSGLTLPMFRGPAPHGRCRCLLPAAEGRLAPLARLLLFNDVPGAGSAAQPAEHGSRRTVKPCAWTRSAMDSRATRLG